MAVSLDESRNPIILVLSRRSLDRDKPAKLGRTVLQQCESCAAQLAIRSAQFACRGPWQMAGHRRRDLYGRVLPVSPIILEEPHPGERQVAARTGTSGFAPEFVLAILPGRSSFGNQTKGACGRRNPIHHRSDARRGSATASDVSKLASLDSPICPADIDMFNCGRSLGWLWHAAIQLLQFLLGGLPSWGCSLRSSRCSYQVAR